MSERDEQQFVEHLINSQNQLWAYIQSLTGKAEQTQDVLQETNRKLWQLKGEYDHSRPFMPWACRVAFNQVRTARKKLQRERLVFHDDETLQVIADARSERLKRLDERAVALEPCLAELGDPQRQLLHDYYSSGNSVKSIAEALGRQANAVAVSLHRIRQALADCIRRKSK